MNSNLSFEIKAEAFRIMTGMMAPGKSVSPLAYDGTTEEDRWIAWKVWLSDNSKILDALMLSIERNMPEEQT